MSISFLAIQGSFGPVEIALFQDGTCVEQVVEYGAKASSHLIPLISTLLKKNNLSLADLAFIVTDKGPGAFTTLRVTITTLNGIAFATHTPLIGLDGLEMLSQQVLSSDIIKDARPTYVAALLNAYSKDVYALVAEINYADNRPCLGKRIFYGCSNIEDLLQDILKIGAHDSILVTGNGAILHADLIKEKMANSALFEQVPTSHTSASFLGLCGLSDFSKQENMSQKIIPNYLKSQLFAVKK